MSDNTAVLTKGARIYSKKRKARKEQVEEVSFDPKDRRTFLTGFHKRKVQRRERAVEQAKLREREEKLLLRKERREQQHEALVNKIRENKSIYGIVDSDSDEQDGSQSGEESAGTENDDEGSGQEEEAEDDEQNQEGNVETSVLRGEDSVTTVRIVRDLDLNALGDDEDILERRLTPQQLIGRLRKDIVDRTRRTAEEEKKQEEASKKSSKKKTKKFRYETKAKRAAKNSKDRAKSKSATHERRAKKGGGKPGKK
ncbi:hypothetical protein LPJ73_002292 [Coemansia sp. RSA 2703]|nr:hypothetical protein LPJ73_002292 [Coemansia sp. RSA 2703]KAJ2375590.1 hypothetical protein IW150_002469 [Coemansia sp. RSA 2607]KAJ2393521.1 hypothetical protein GGI05_002403 [Coemansia sp. RSA 2603]